MKIEKQKKLAIAYAIDLLQIKKSAISEVQVNEDNDGDVNCNEVIRIYLKGKIKNTKYFDRLTGRITNKLSGINPDCVTTDCCLQHKFSLASDRAIALVYVSNPLTQLWRRGDIYLVLTNYNFEQ